MAGEADYRDAAPPGTQIGPLVLGKAMGQGGEGIVYHAVHAELGDVVVKEFWPKQIASRARGQRVEPAQSGWQADYRRGVERFQALGERLQALPSHPGVVRVHEILTDRNTAYLVMAPVHGRPLGAALAEGGFRDPEQVMTLADRLTATLAWLHEQGLLHRDIAPDNIIITPGHDWDPVLVDFNAAKDMMVRVSRTNEGVMKPGYTPIEQYDVEGKEPIGAWTDIYATAAVLHCAITGAPPPDPAIRLLRPGQYKPLSRRPDLRYPPEFLAAIDHGLDPHPDKRPQTVEAWREAMGEALPSRVEAVRAARRAEEERRAKQAAEAEAARIAAEAAAAAEAARIAAEAEAARRAAEVEATRVAAEAEAAAAQRREERHRAELAAAEASRQAEDEARQATEARRRQEAERAAAAKAERTKTQAAVVKTVAPAAVAAALVVGIAFFALVAVIMVVSWNRGAMGVAKPTPVASESAGSNVTDPIGNTVVTHSEKPVPPPAPTGRATQSATKGTPAPIAQPTQGPIQQQVCRQECVDGPLLYAEQEQTTQGPWRSMGQASFTDGVTSPASAARAKAESVCGRGKVADVRFADAECPQSICFVKVTAACTITQTVRVPRPGPQQCRTVCTP